MAATGKNKIGRIVILGANGQVGRIVFQHCCRSFTSAEVIGCVRREHLNFEGCTGDKLQHSFIFDPFSDDWNRLGKTDVLINCIGIIREHGEFTFERAHIGLTRLMLAHREALGNPLMIQVSVLGADKHSPSRFMSTKAKADEELLIAENTCIIRPSIVCTHNTIMVQKLKMLGKISRKLLNVLPFPSGFLETRIQPVMGEDVAAAIVRLIVENAPVRIINVTGPETISLEELLKIITSGLIGEGEYVTWRAKHFGIVQELTTVIAECDPPHFFYKQDGERCIQKDRA